MITSRFRPAPIPGLLLFLLLASTIALGQQAESEWVVLAPTGEGFSVRMPIKPTEETELVAMLGKNYQMRMYTSTDEGKRMIYMMVMQEFSSEAKALTPSVRIEKFMAGFKEGFEKTSGGKKVDLQSGIELDLQNRSGRQYALKVGDMASVVRAFDGDQRIYLLLVMNADEKNEGVTRFFNSFEFKPALAPVPRPIPVAPPAPVTKPS